MITNQDINNSKSTNDEKETTTMSEKENKNETNNTSYYEECVKNLSAPESVDYLASRGVSLSTAQQFHCGYDPATKCIIVPINDQSYIARSIDDTSTIRFKNPVGQKTGITNSGALFSDDDTPIVVVKGAFDMLSVAEIGANAIALNGICQNSSLINLIQDSGKKVKKTLLIDLGNDIEGRENSQKLAEELTKIGVKCKVVNLSSGYRDLNEALQMQKGTFFAKATASVDAITKPDNTYSYYINGDFANDVAEMKATEHRKTGFPLLDKKIGVMTNGLYILGGIPSVGKTTFMLQLADQMARRGEHVLYFTLEQTKLELFSKSVARESALKYWYENNGPGTYVTSSDVQYEHNLEERDKAIRNYFGFVEDRSNIVVCFSGLTVGDIEAKVKEYESYNKVKPIVIIDYLQSLEAEADPVTHRKASDVKQIVEENISRLQGLSKSMGLLIFAISSLNRNNYTNSLDFNAFKETGKIEYGADRLFGLSLAITHDPKFVTAPKDVQQAMIEEAKEKIPRRIEFKCLKNRSGCPIFSLIFDYYPNLDLYVEKKEEKKK